MERSFIAYLKGRCRHLPQVHTGIGDDAAVLEPLRGKQVICTDQILEGVDFRAAEHSLRDIGWKAMAVNLSDIAAMGAVPTAALVTLTLPKDDATRFAGEVYEGIFEAAERHGVAIAGGDISTHTGGLAVSITMLGNVAEGNAWLRSGAVEGDAILVSGAFGGSLLGRHLRPDPRLELAAAVRDLADVHAAIDVSDGLSIDLDRMLASSRLGGELDVASIPVHPDADRMAKQTGKLPFQHAWSDGEDFELIIAVGESDAQKLLSQSSLPAPLTRIGTVVGRTGLWKKMSGRVERLFPQGYQHT